MMKRTVSTLLLGLAALLVLPLSGLAQETGTVTGTVTDSETGDPLPGASVLIVELQQGTATGRNGAYTIEEVTPGEYTIRASFLGYQELEGNIQIDVEAGETVTQNFELTPDYTDLEEVVVIGYGERSRRDVTGSVSSVDAEEIQNVTVSSPEELLQGRTAGVQLTKSSGLAGAPVNVNVRGISSIESGTQPLYVIDGVPIASGTSASDFGQANNVLQSLNPQDIQSIEVLKDASATAIYGSRGANGVVLISTKTGSATGRTTVNFNYSIGQTSAVSEWDILTGPQYAEITQEAVRNYLPLLGLDPSNFPNPADALFGTQNFTFPQPEEAPTHSYVDEAFRKGLQQQFNLSARGGNESTRFYASGTYFDTEGYVLGNRFQRLSGRVNLDHDLSDWARFGARIGLTRVLNDRASSDNNVSGILSSAALRPPILPIRNEDGSFNWSNPINIGENIVASAEENDSDDYEWRTIGSVFAEVDPVENLTLRANGGLDLVTTDEYFLNVQESVDGRPNGAREQYYREQRRYLLEGTADYTNTFADDHFLNVIAGTSYERNERNNVFAAASNFATNALRNVASGSEPTLTSSEVDRKWRLFSGFARANYSYDDRYILEASFRADASSRFSEDNRTGYFPAGAVAWRLSEERFMEGVEAVNELKLRVSYGVTGNDQIGTFPSLALFTASADYNESPALAPDQLASPDLKWETVNELDIGLDLGLFNQRIFLTADFYNARTTDLILPVQLSRTSGYNEVVQNVGNLRNRGLEFSLETQNLTGAFNWSTSLNLSTNSNEVTELADNDGDGEGDPIPSFKGNSLIRIEEGRPLGAYYLVPYAGVDPETGLPLFVNQEGEEVSTYSSSYRRFVGNLNPDWSGGITNRLGYKGVELSFLVQFETGADFYNGTKEFLMNPVGFNTHEDILDRWQEPGDQTDVPKVVFNDTGVNGTEASTRFLEDGSYLRLKDVTLGYSLPAGLASSLSLRGARIYVKGQNLLTFDSLSIGDPESATVDTRGDVFFTPPQQRVIQAGFDLTF